MTFQRWLISCSCGHYRFKRLAWLWISLLALLPAAWARPKTIVISLDGATPRLVNKFLQNGVLPAREGLGLLKHAGIVARQTFTTLPSLTAVGHTAIASGSTAASNDIPSNTFHLLASPFTSNISGFGAPIGGYSIDGPGESQNPTAFPIWHSLLPAGKSVATATFPGGDGVDVKVPGLQNSPIIQPASERTVTYTVPFGEFGGISAQGFTLAASDFGPAPQSTVDQLNAAGKVSYSPVLQKLTAFETFTVGGVNYTILVAALDTSDDSQLNYDTLVFWDANQGIQPGPFQLPSTGPAYVKASDGKSSPFYLEGSPKKAGTGYFVTIMAPDLSVIHVARYAANDIPPNAAVQPDVDDINTHVGFWAPQADFRIPERLSAGFTAFSDAELETLFEDQVRVFVDYQTRVALRAIERNPDIDLLMVYIEQPDGSEHQFLLVDPRQATNPRDPGSIGNNQDPAKLARYAHYVEVAYQAANSAVQRIIDAVGVDSHGIPKSDIFVVSDHGFDPFHTAVSMNNLLASAGIPSSKVRAVTSGPAVNLYISLQGREPDGIVGPDEYIALQQQVAALLSGLSDTNPFYGKKHQGVPVFDIVHSRPLPQDHNDPNFARGTDDVIGQDSGDVFATLSFGYNFDGTQSPVVQRIGDAPQASPVLSLPNFYGAHGYDPAIKHMSAIFFAAGPDIRHGKLDAVRNIDIAPTLATILGVTPDTTVQGQVLDVFEHSLSKK
jgi:hypothetical protein